MRARVIYDFTAQGEGELSVACGEEVTITDQTVGAGWWEALNASGKTGLVPSSFVEPVDIPEPSLPPPPVPPLSSSHTNPDAFQDWDDDWDSEDSNPPTLERSSSDGVHRVIATVPAGAYISKPSGSTSAVFPVHSDAVRCASIRRVFHRSFIRTGGEDFLLNTDPPSQPHREAMIEFIDGLFQWQKIPTPVQCRIASFRKDTKLKGMKSFIAYQLTTSLTEAHVSRRFKHFDWLHARLVSKYPCICIPPLPDKVITGRYEDEFVDERRKWLQQWLNRMCAHPVVAQSNVFHHFLTCTDFKLWKQGKREAESEWFQGGRFYFAVDSQDPQSAADYTSEKADAAERFSLELERCVRGLTEAVVEFHRRLAGSYRKDFANISTSFAAMCRTLDNDVHTRHLNGSLCKALSFAGETYNSISKDHGAQTEPCSNLIECLRDYMRLTSTLPAVVSMAKCACLVSDDVSRTHTDDKLSQNDITNIKAGTLVMTRSVQAECNHLMDQLRRDYLSKFAAYLHDRANFYRKMADQLDAAASAFQM